VESRIWIVLLVLLGSGLFSGAETALISINKIKLRSWADKGGRLAWLARRFIDRPGDLLATLLVGNNLMNILATVIISDLFFRLVPPESARALLPYSALIIPALVTPPVLIFGEVIPKTIAREHSSRVLNLVLTPLIASYYLLLPVARFSYLITRALLGAVGVGTPRREELFTRRNVQRVLVESERGGVLEAEERGYISGVFEFGETMAREVMTPRTGLVAIRRDAEVIEIVEKMCESNFSRIPVYEGSLDHIVGIVHVVDLMKSEEISQPLIHPVIFTPETRKCDSLLYEMRQKKIHLAVVLDEYGGTSGIVTLEDLLEELVGDIRDVYDKGGSLVTVGRDLSIIVSGRTRLEDLEGKIDLPQKDYEVETIGGLLVTELGRIPEAGEKFQLGPVRITVLEASANRVERLQLKKVDQPEEERGPERNQIRRIEDKKE
jgi:putative hemolysin